MSEERLKAVEDLVTNLRIENAKLSEAIEHLSTTVSSLTSVVQEIRDAMNKGKGAIWLFGVLSAAVGAFISWVTTLFSR